MANTETSKTPFVPFEEYGDILDTDDLCREFKASPQTIRRMCADGVLPAFKMGRMWYVRKDKLIEFTEVRR